MLIPVVFTPDENYMIPTCVAILSMIETKKKDTKYKFYIIISEKFKKDNLRYLDYISGIKNEFEYEVIRINTDIFDRQRINTRHLTTNTYYRLLIAELINDDKCMYHDGDIIVNDDLSEMYEVNMNSNYVAGVKAYLRHQDTEENFEFMKKWGYPALDNYILCGDLVFNLQKIREKGIGSKLLDAMEKNFPSEDLDVINYCCYGNITFLPLKFCMLNRWINNNSLLKMKKAVYSRAEIEEAQSAPVIIHFAGGNVKPWNNLRTVYSRQWWAYAQKFLPESEYNALYSRAEEITKSRDYSYLMEKLDSVSDIIIFGCGKCGRLLFGKLQSTGKKIACFADNASGKWGTEYCGCKVMSVEEALKEFPDAVIVNSIQGFTDEITEQLMKMGVEKKHIIGYEVKNETYYKSLSSEYFEYEFNEWCLKEFGWRFGKIINVGG